MQMNVFHEDISIIELHHTFKNETKLESFNGVHP